MTTILIRHFESFKNTQRRLSSAGAEEPLTSKGAKLCALFAREFRGFVDEVGVRNVSLHSSSAQRSAQTAMIIADALGGVQVKRHDALKSTHAGPYAGLSDAQIRRVDRGWLERLRMYRLGMYNLYNMDREWRADGKESKRDFERRVIACFADIAEADQALLKVIVTSRSVINAILIHIARQIYGYPEEFYGYVRVDVGTVCILTRASGGLWRVEALHLKRLASLKVLTGCAATHGTGLSIGNGFSD